MSTDSTDNQLAGVFPLVERVKELSVARDDLLGIVLAELLLEVGDLRSVSCRPSSVGVPVRAERPREPRVRARPSAPVGHRQRIVGSSDGAHARAWACPPSRRVGERGQQIASWFALERLATAHFVRTLQLLSSLSAIAPTTPRSTRARPRDPGVGAARPSWA